MLPLLLAGIVFVLWALFIINVYYSTYYSSIDHINVDYIQPLINSSTSFFSSPFGKYIMTVLFFYWIYKIYTAYFSWKKEIRFSVFSLIGIFFLHLLIVASIYANMTEGGQMIVDIGTPNWFGLFLHVISLLIYPTVLTLISRACGYSILSRIFMNWSERDIRMSILVDTTLGFFVFSTLMLVLAMIGIYTLLGLFIVLGLMVVIGWSGWKKTYTDISKCRAVFENHTSGKWLIASIAPKLLTAEFAYFVFTLMLSVAMISIIRPMPIGWDDLGVYMNYGKMLALTSTDLPGAGIYAWQLITGSGFLFSYTAAQAFFINQFGSILAVVAVTLGLSVLFEQKWKKSLMALPFILAVVYFVMPMTVFQHTKDMKLDPALLFFSVSVFMLFFTTIKDKILDTDKKTGYKILIVIGVLLGFVFSVKVTTLMLILAIFGLFAYRLLSFWWYMWFFFVFLAIFTGLNLWSIMNVWMPVDPALLSAIAWVLALIGWVCFMIGSIWKIEQFKQYIIGSIILILSFAVWLSPWIIKNTSEVQPWNIEHANIKDLAMQSILSGSGAGFNVDFTRIMTAEEYKTRSDIIKSVNISSDGQSKNEDFGRYFGYEEGINNYVRLPMNLTFQRNQGGEFTAITYIFLALVPVLFLFARGRFPWVYGSIVSVSLFTLFVYSFVGGSQTDGKTYLSPIQAMIAENNATIIKNESAWGLHLSDIGTVFIKKPILEWLEKISLGATMTDILSLKMDVKYPLLYGYLILLICNIIFVAVIHFLTRNEEEDKSFRDMVVVLNIYWFLFLISAFGIVWYGIFVYFIFFALIWLLAQRWFNYDTEDTQEENIFAIRVTLAALLFIFISLYFVRTAIPHAWTNLKSAWFNEYKYGILNQEETLFAYRSDYLIPIAVMNLKDIWTLTWVIDKVSNTKLKELLTKVSDTPSLFLEATTQVIPQAQKSKDPILKNDGKIMTNYIYNKALYPSQEESNTGWIYRIGTFMTYLINKNLERYYDDSLVFGFDGYFYDESPEKTIEKMRKLGFKFLLIDLNAATIDRDPRRALTKRYEHLLLTMRAKNLKLVNTDNLCLQFALDEYKTGKLQKPEEFIDIAGTNYESYRENGNGDLVTISRGQKQRQCYAAMLKSITDEDGANRYDYLAGIQNTIEKNDAMNNPELLTRIMRSYAGQSFFALYEITDTPVESNTTTVTPTQSGVTAQ